MSTMPWWWNNVVTTPNRWMAYWLRRRGWVCFYLDEPARECRAVCWMQEYQRSERKESR